ncbi:hypothetical protein Tco_1010659 [Tanacetum coccineum]
MFNHHSRFNLRFSIKGDATMDANSREKKRNNSYTTNLVVNQEKRIKKQVADSMEKEMSKLQKKVKKKLQGCRMKNTTLTKKRSKQRLKKRKNKLDIEDIKIKEGMNQKASRNKKIGESKINRLGGNIPAQHPTRGPAPSNRVPDMRMRDKDSRSSKIEKDDDRKRTKMHSSDKRSKLDKGDEDSHGYGGKPPRYDSGKTHLKDDDRRKEKRSKHESESYQRDYIESDRRSSREESYGRENQESDRRSSRS